METNMDANVLSTPNLLTLDNEEAKIVIGQNVPFVTGQFTSAGAGSNGTVNPFQTIERKDVGLTLRVRPQISQDGTVKLAVFQEVSSVSAASGASGLVTDKRSIESTVVVDDGTVVVLGGLLQEQNTKGRDKVPLLGDLPGVGALFRTDTNNRQKTNLMVFLRPVVVRDRQALEELSGGKYEAMKALRDVAGAPTMPIAPDPKSAKK
jgi:general secretion pathway protein D